MKTQFIAVLASLALTVTGAQAQSTASAGAEANSQSQANLQNQTAAYNNITFESGGGTSRSKVAYGGEYTVRSAPSVQPPSVGGGHPCAVGQASLGLSIIGGGGSGTAGQRVDEACLLAQMGQGAAAIIMIAERDEASCKALRQVGTVGPATICTKAEERAAKKRQQAAERAIAAQQRAAERAARVSTRNTPKMVSIADVVTGCSRDPNGATRISVKHGMSNLFTSRQLEAYCAPRM